MDQCAVDQITITRQPTQVSRLAGLSLRALAVTALMLAGLCLAGQGSASVAATGIDRSAITEMWSMGLPPMDRHAKSSGLADSRSSQLVDGRYVYATRGRLLLVVDSANPSVIRRIPMSASATGPMVADPFKAALFVLTLDGIVRVDTRSWTVGALIPVLNVQQLLIDEDSGLLYTRAEHSLLQIDPETHAIRTLALPAPRSTSVMVLASGGSRLYLSSYANGCCDGNLIAVDTATLDIVAELPLAVRGPLVADALGSRVYASVSGAIVVIDAASAAPITTLTLPNPVIHSLSTMVIAFDPTRGRTFVGLASIGSFFGSAYAFLWALDSETLAPIGLVELDLAPRALVVDSSAGRLYFSGQTKDLTTRPTQQRPAGIQVVDAVSLASIATVPPISDAPFSVSMLTLNSRANAVYSSDSSGIYGIDTRDYSLKTVLPGASSLLVAADLPAVGGDNHHFVLGSRSGLAMVRQWGAPGDYSLPADYDGDKRADVAVLRPRAGSVEAVWFLTRSTDGGSGSTQWGSVSAGDVPVPGDYDGDGKTDIAVWRPAVGEWFIRRSSDGEFTQTRFGISTNLPVPADYDGDRKTDFAVYRNGNWQIFGSSVGAMTIELGGGFDLPVAHDYDGDGKADAAVYHPISGIWQIRDSSTGAVRSVQWGIPGDIPVPADYDGDGRADIAIWRPSTGVWWIISSATGAIRSEQWGGAGDRPQPADYNGDGAADFGVHRP